MLTSERALFPASLAQAESLPVYGHLIGNRWVASEPAPLAVVAPATGERFAWLARGGAKEIDAAVAAARAALDGEWVA